MELDPLDKRVLVTGSSSGIGEGIEVVMAREGARLIVHGRDAARTRAVADRLRQIRTEVAVANGELDKDEDCATVAETTLASPEGVDILVNNAGGMATPTCWTNRLRASVGPGWKPHGRTCAGPTSRTWAAPFALSSVWHPA